MTQVIMSPNLKRIRTYIKNGKVYEGGIEEMFSATNPSGSPITAGIPETSGDTREAKKV